jgi:hypothetical protein
MSEVEHRDQQVVSFYDEAILDMAKSETAQRPIFDTVVMAKVQWIGQPGQNFTGPATAKFRLAKGKANRRNTYGFERAGGWESPAEAFPEEWAVYQGKADARGRGTPLEHLPFITKGKLAELNYMEIHTAEQLASIGANAAKVLGMGGTALVEQARAWISDTTDKAAAASAMAEKAALEERLAALEARLAAPQEAPKVDAWDAQDDDELRAFIVSKGGNPRANAARDKLLQACRELSEMVG